MNTKTIKRTVPRNAKAARPDAAPNNEQMKEPRRTAEVALRVILVPVDFSATSLKALDFAIALAKPFGATVELLHVLDAMYSAGRFDAPKLRGLRREALRDAKRRLANVARRNVNGRLRHTVVNGIPYSEIVDKAVWINANMIVMGSRGRTGLGRLLVGSVAEKVVRHAHCPVLIARDNGGRERASANGKRKRKK
jgi:nucleotide-binding universal stress UspA family protein